MLRIKIKTKDVIITFERVFITLICPFQLFAGGEVLMTARLIICFNNNRLLSKLHIFSVGKARLFPKDNVIIERIYIMLVTPSFFELPSDWQ
jgi:hypothetical protein